MISNSSIFGHMTKAWISSFGQLKRDYASSLKTQTNNGLIDGMWMFLLICTDILIFCSFKFQNLSKQIFVLVWIGIVFCVGKNFVQRCLRRPEIQKIWEEEEMEDDWRRWVAEERLQVINLITCAQIQSQWLQFVQTSTNIKANRSIHTNSSSIKDSLTVSHQICF